MYAVHLYDIGMFGQIDFPGFEREVIGISHWMLDVAIANCISERYVSVTDEAYHAMDHYIGDRLNNLPDNLLRYVEKQIFAYHSNAQYYFCQRQPIETASLSDRYRGATIVLKE